MADLRAHRKAADNALDTLKLVENDKDTPGLVMIAGRVRTDMVRLADLRHRLDAAIDGPVTQRPADLAEKFFAAQNNLVNDLDMLLEVYSNPIISMVPQVAQRIRFARAAWQITEYAGREYALLGRLIAEGKYPDKHEERDLLVWQGRIEYGWEILRGFISSNEWGETLRPHLDEARTQYLITFEQIKGIFSPKASGKPNYPITADMWLSLAAQSVDSLHTMMDSVMRQNRQYVDSFRDDAERTIWWSALLFTFALALSIYSWLVIHRRVIGPVNAMADALYRSARGEAFEMPAGPHGQDEIGKLVTVLQLVQENSRQLEAERDKAKAANVAKSEFLANMSHEIRTPMNVVLGLANILGLSAPLTDKQREFIKTLRMSAESLLSIINDLLDFSKIETGGFALENISFNLSDLSKEVFALTSIRAREKGLDFRIEASAVEGREYMGDPTRLRQVLTNLCSNAVKFTSVGGISLGIQARPAAVEGMDDVFIQVTDTGVGIPAEKVGIIFDKFTQADTSISRKFGGTGLGLAIAKTFIEMMDGTISVDSREGSGSTFTIYLPLAHSGAELDVRPQMPEGSRKVSRSETAEGQRVLLVEDYAPNALVAGVFIEQFGYVHDVAESGAAALEKFDKQNYYAILMDVQMQGMDGYQTTRAIRQREKEKYLPRTKIIGMTAHALAGDREKCLEAGMDDYIAKPFRPEDLRKKLARPL
ncbi:MAG: ATP-binding protein [Micavibrio sp.]|nr:ATP-binding protein [Micavibrio sp.]